MEVVEAPGPGNPLERSRARGCDEKEDADEECFLSSVATGAAPGFQIVCRAPTSGVRTGPPGHIKRQ